MSEPPPTYAFPQRAPVFTAVVVLAALGLFVWFVHRLYHPAPPVNPLTLVNPADFGDAERWQMTYQGRADHLAELHRHEHEEATTYGWIDRKAGIVRLPIDRAIELTARDYGKK